MDDYLKPVLKYMKSHEVGLSMLAGASLTLGILLAFAWNILKPSPKPQLPNKDIALIMPVHLTPTKATFPLPLLFQRITPKPQPTHSPLSTEGIQEALTNSIRNTRPGRIGQWFTGILDTFAIKNEGKITKQSASTTSAEIATSPSIIKSKTHIVKRNETLWSIAQYYFNDGYSFQQIAAVNKLSNANKIEVGQELEIPNMDSLGSTNQTLPKIHRVARGEHLWKIAEKYYGSGNKYTLIVHNNQKLVGKTPSLIQPGWELLVPPENPPLATESRPLQP